MDLDAAPLIAEINDSLGKLYRTTTGNKNMSDIKRFTLGAIDVQAKADEVRYGVRLSV